MMSKTPSKTETNQFVTKEIFSPSPNKDQPGISKTVFSHISNLHGLVKDWTRMREKGSLLLDCISALNLHECNDNYFPSQLKPLMTSIVEIIESLKNIVDSKLPKLPIDIGANILKTQIQALARLQPTETPVISAWPISKISESVGSIYEQLWKEYRLKSIITENIAHCRDEKLIEVYMSSWELEPYFNRDICAYLFAEVGIS